MRATGDGDGETLEEMIARLRAEGLNAEERAETETRRREVRQGDAFQEVRRDERREWRREYDHNAYYADPEKTKQHNKEHWERRRERMANDPEYKERIRRQQRESVTRRRAENPDRFKADGRERDRRRRERLLAAPEALARDRERKRLDQRRRRERIRREAANKPRGGDTAT